MIIGNRRRSELQISLISQSDRDKTISLRFFAQIDDLPLDVKGLFYSMSSTIAIF